MALGSMTWGGVEWYEGKQLLWLMVSEHTNDMIPYSVSFLYFFTCALMASSSHWSNSLKGLLGSFVSSNPCEEYSWRRSAILLGLRMI